MCPDRFSDKTPLWFDSHMRPPPVTDPPKNRILNGSRLYREFAHFQTLSPLINPVRVIVSEFARIRIFRAASTFRKNEKLPWSNFVVSCRGCTQEGKWKKKCDARAALLFVAHNFFSWRSRYRRCHLRQKLILVLSNFPSTDRDFNFGSI